MTDCCSECECDAVPRVWITSTTGEALALDLQLTERRHAFRTEDWGGSTFDTGRGCVFLGEVAPTEAEPNRPRLEIAYWLDVDRVTVSPVNEAGHVLARHEYEPFRELFQALLKVDVQETANHAEYLITFNEWTTGFDFVVEAAGVDLGQDDTPPELQRLVEPEVGVGLQFRLLLAQPDNPVQSVTTRLTIDGLSIELFATGLAAPTAAGIEQNIEELDYRIGEGCDAMRRDVFEIDRSHGDAALGPGWLWQNVHVRVEFGCVRPPVKRQADFCPCRFCNVLFRPIGFDVANNFPYQSLVDTRLNRCDWSFSVDVWNIAQDQTQRFTGSLKLCDADWSLELLQPNSVYNAATDRFDFINFGQPVRHLYQLAGDPPDCNRNTTARFEFDRTKWDKPGVDLTLEQLPPGFDQTAFDVVFLACDDQRHGFKRRAEVTVDGFGDEVIDNCWNCEDLNGTFDVSTETHENLTGRPVPTRFPDWPFRPLVSGLSFVHQLRNQIGTLCDPQPTVGLIYMPDDDTLEWPAVFFHDNPGEWAQADLAFRSPIQPARMRAFIRTQTEFEQTGFHAFHWFKPDTETVVGAMDARTVTFSYEKSIWFQNDDPNDETSGTGDWFVWPNFPPGSDPDDGPHCDPTGVTITARFTWTSDVDCERCEPFNVESPIVYELTRDDETIQLLRLGLNRWLAEVPPADPADPTEVITLDYLNGDFLLTFFNRDAGGTLTMKTVYRYEPWGISPRPPVDDATRDDVSEFWNCQGINRLVRRFQRAEEPATVWPDFFEVAGVATVSPHGMTAVNWNSTTRTWTINDDTCEDNHGPALPFTRGCKHDEARSTPCGFIGQQEEPFGPGTCAWQWVDANVRWRKLVDGCSGRTCRPPAVDGDFPGQIRRNRCQGSPVIPAVPCVWVWNESQQDWLEFSFACGPGYTCEKPTVAGNFDGETRVACSGSPCECVELPCDGECVWGWESNAVIPRWVPLGNTCSSFCGCSDPPGFDGFPGQQVSLPCSWGVF